MGLGRGSSAALCFPFSSTTQARESRGVCFPAQPALPIWNPCNYHLSSRRTVLLPVCSACLLRLSVVCLSACGPVWV